MLDECQIDDSFAVNKVVFKEDWELGEDLLVSHVVDDVVGVLINGFYALEETHDKEEFVELSVKDIESLFTDNFLYVEFVFIFKIDQFVMHLSFEVV